MIGNCVCNRLLTLERKLLRGQAQEGGGTPHHKAIYALNNKTHPVIQLGFGKFDGERLDSGFCVTHTQLRDFDLTFDDVHSASAEVDLHLGYTQVLQREVKLNVLRLCKLLLLFFLRFFCRCCCCICFVHQVHPIVVIHLSTCE